MNQAKQKGEVHRYKTLYESYHNTSNIKLREPQEAGSVPPSARDGHRGSRQHEQSQGVKSPPGAERSGSRARQGSHAKTREREEERANRSESPGKSHEQSKRRSEHKSSMGGSRANSRLNQQPLVEIKVEQTDVTEDDLTHPPKLSQIKETEGDVTQTQNDLPEELEFTQDEASKPVHSNEHSCADNDHLADEGEFQACTHEDMKQLANLLKGIKFFSDRNIKNPQDLLEVAKTLLLENFDTDEMVFDHGEPGSKFYIILKGAVGVDIPIRIKVEQDELDRRRTLFLTEKLRMVTMIKQLEIELQRKEQREIRKKNEEE